MARNGPPNPFPTDNVATDNIPWDTVPFHVQSRMPFAKPDIDVFVALESNELLDRVLLNEGIDETTGEWLGFSVNTVPETDQWNYDVALGDVDGDGDLDGLVANYNGGVDDLALLNEGIDETSGEWLGFSVYTVPGTDQSSISIALGDLDDDGDLDALVGNDGPENHVWINEGVDETTGELAFSVSSIEGTNGRSQGVAFGDLNDDGYLDALVANVNSDNQVLINDGVDEITGEWLGFSVTTIAETNPTSVRLALGDLDGDGDIDAIVSNQGPDQENEAWINQGIDGTTGEWLGFDVNTITDTAGYSAGVAIGDLDNDGDFDAVVQNEGRTDFVLLNEGVDETSGEWLGFRVDTLATLGFNGLDIALGDLDGDGDLDAFAAIYGPEDDNLWINEGIDETTGEWLGFSVTTVAGSGIDSQGVALGDLDGDSTVPAVDEYGLPNINQDGLLPSMYVDIII